jgi:predicted O-methyltransferase YrrM
MRFLEDVRAAITAAERDGQVTPPNVREVLTGLSGGKLIGALQRLARLYEGDETCCYLEIGVFRGLSLLSVASAAPRLTCYGVDNFMPLDREQNDSNYDLVRGKIDKLGLTNIQILKADFEEALTAFDQTSGGKKIGLLFVDGPHDYRSQIICLLFAKHVLAENCVIIVDDSNYNHVRQTNRDFLIAHPDFKLIFEAYTNRHPGNQSATEREASDSFCERPPHSCGQIRATGACGVESIPGSFAVALAAHLPQTLPEPRTAK